MKKILQQHFKDYPKAELQDFFKLIHQSEFGPGHLIADPKENFKRLQAEFTNLETTVKTQVIEILQPQLCRLHLQVLKQTTLSIETLQQFFEISSKDIMGDLANYFRKISDLKALCRDGSLAFTETHIKGFITAHIKHNPTGLIRHSETYRRTYAPAYRVVQKRFCDMLPLFARIDGLLDEKDQVVIAIDGDCASGKSTLAKMIKEVYDCNIIQMDDFFLQTEQHTEERLATTGGNIDHERFTSEVLPYLRSNESFSYQPFNCTTRKFDKPLSFTTKKLTIIEGSYSHHPLLSNQYDLKVFLSIPEVIQLDRILKRNGMSVYDKFKNIWIPMEKKYAAAFDIKAHSDLQFDYLDY